MNAAKPVVRHEAPQLPRMAISLTSLTACQVCTLSVIWQILLIGNL
jgi:hypothetical protein